MSGGLVMSFFKKLFKIESKPGSRAYRAEKARELHGQPIQYVTECKDCNEDVVGRGGSLAVHNGNFIVDSSGDRLFVCDIRDVDISWLMSGNGVIVKGPNQLEGGRLRVLTVHFVYHRK